MKRLYALAAFAALFAVTGWAALSAQADDKPTAGRTTGKAPDPHHAMYADCAKVCAECMLSCEMTAHHCAELAATDKKDHVKSMLLAADCAEFCALSAKLTSRHSALAPAACEACAKACDLCTAACEKSADMPEMKACAEACKKCAASCREMAKMGGHKE